MFAWQSPAGTKARLSILIFHRVLPRPDPLFPNEMHARRFDVLCGWLRSWFNVLPLDVAVRRLASGTLPARAACITFDDGYADNATVALPILLRHEMAATFFVATSFLDGGRMWNDSVIEAVRACPARSLDLCHAGLGSFELDSPAKRRAAIDALLGEIKYLAPVERKQTVELVQQTVAVHLPADLMMTSSQVMQLHRAGMQVGAHTCTHPILASLPDADALEEMRLSKANLEAIVQAPVDLFAYPNGKPGRDYLPKHAKMAQQCGFMAAVSTAPGVSLATTDHFQLPRFSPWDSKRLMYGSRMLINMREARPITA